MAGGSGLLSCRRGGQVFAAFPFFCALDLILHCAEPLLCECEYITTIGRRGRGCSPTSQLCALGGAADGGRVCFGARRLHPTKQRCALGAGAEVCCTARALLLLFASLVLNEHVQNAQSASWRKEEAHAEYK